MTLVGDHRRDAQHRPAGLRTRCELGTDSSFSDFGLDNHGFSDSGLGNVQSLQGQLVQVKHPVAVPLARGDHGGRGHKSCALAHLDRLGRLAGGAVTQRHVQEDHQSEAPRFRHQYPGRRRGDQPVEQNHGPVGETPDDIVQGGERPGVGARPVPGHGVLAYHPSEVAQPAADEAVVGVPATGLRWIVDALGHHDIHDCHRDRS